MDCHEKQPRAAGNTETNTLANSREYQGDDLELAEKQPGRPMETGWNTKTNSAELPGKRNGEKRERRMQRGSRSKVEARNKEIEAGRQKEGQLQENK